MAVQRINGTHQICSSTAPVLACVQLHHAETCQDRPTLALMLMLWFWLPLLLFL
jgi:hypothetical protein